MKGEKPPGNDIFIEWTTPSDYRSGAFIEAEFAFEDSIKKVTSASIRTIISKDGWKLALSNRDKSQLFNLNDDPFETTNLFYKKEHIHTIQELTKKILEWQELTKDLIHFTLN